MKQMLTIVLLNYNGTEDTIACLKSLDQLETHYSYQIIVLDNASSLHEYQLLHDYCIKRLDFSVCLLSEFEQRDPCKNYLVRSFENYGFARGNNEIIRRIINNTRYVLLLNNDTEVKTTFVEKMLQFLEANVDVKYASCRINNYFDKEALWSCGGDLKFWGNRHSFTEKELLQKGSIIETPYITGCALFLETNMLKEQGMLSEDFFFGEEDFNFSWRMKKARIRGACLNEVLVYHKISQSSSKSGNSIGKNAGYYCNRIIDMRKFYNPVIWHVWKELMIIFIIYSCIRNRKMTTSQTKEVVKIVRQYSYNTRLTQEDCLQMRRF